MTRKPHGIFELELDYPRVSIWRRPRYKEEMYYPSNASWNRLQRVLNAMLDKSGVEIKDISKATFLL